MLETIKIHGTTLVTSELPAVMQSMVALLEHAIQKESEAKKDLGTFEAGRLEITRRLVTEHQKILDQPQEITEPVIQSIEGGNCETS